MDLRLHTFRQFVDLLKESFGNFQRHRAQWLAAAIAYFTLFAIAPLIIVLVEIVGIVVGGHRTTLNELYGYLRSTSGPAAAEGIRSIVAATFAERRAGVLAQAIGWTLFVLAALGLFGALQQALNVVWEVEPKKGSWLTTLRDRAASFGVVLGTALLLVVSVAVTSGLTLAAHALGQVSPIFPALMKVVDFAVSLGVMTLLFALLFEVLPECQIAWGDVWLGSAFSALLFVAGQFLLGWYLGRTAAGSTYGAFGGLVVFLIWANYSAQILLLGAEFTSAYAARHGSRAGGKETPATVNTIAGTEPAKAKPA